MSGSVTDDDASSTVHKDMRDRLPYVDRELAKKVDAVLGINRAERQYVKVRYDEVPYLQKAGIDFYALQALFWNTWLMNVSSSATVKP